MIKIFALGYAKWSNNNLQTRTKSLKPGIVLGVGWSVKLVLQTETQKSQF